MFDVRFVVRFALVLFAATFTSLGHAQFPSKPIKLVVAWAPGGSSDIVARAVTSQVQAETGHTFVVEYKPGANGSIGTSFVANSDPDGHTLLLATLSHVTSPSLMKDLPWHPTKSFSGIALLATVPAVAVVNPSIPATNLKELVTFAKRNPGKLNYLSPGAGTSMHLNAELVNMEAGIDMVPVLYKGVGPGIPDLLTNRISVAFLPVSAATGHIKSNSLRPLFMASTKRNSLLPDVPTAAEAGYPEAQVVSWFTVLAPANTPPERLRYLNKILNASLSNPAMEKKFEEVGVSSVTPMTPEQVDAMLASDTARYGKVLSAKKVAQQ